MMRVFYKLHELSKLRVIQILKTGWCIKNEPEEYYQTREQDRIDVLTPGQNSGLLKIFRLQEPFYL